jgi:hypothetical protein
MRRDSLYRRRRQTLTSTTQRAGCYECHGYDAHWLDANAQALAARHTDATGHKTWVDALLSITYCVDSPQAPQLFSEVQG